MEKIEILGSGCQSCEKLYKTVIEAAQELELSCEINHITDITKAIELGIMSMPALVIDGEVITTGTIPNKEEAKAIIKSHQ